MTDNFYRAFEEKYRGSRELIKSRLGAYQPFLEPLLNTSPAAEAIDLGCGRGEWLEYVTSLGFSAKGIDLDDGMLAACEELGLSAEKGDLLKYVRSLAQESVSLVTAFHVVEHIAFDDLRTLVEEALRVLKPGGLLIMETPNPENIVVGTSSFYLDPTHQQPIPAELLTFVSEYSGFDRVKALKLQEPQGIFSKDDVGLWDVFSGVSPDYAVIAQKAGAPFEIAAFDGAFESEFGVGLDLLATRFDNSLFELRKQVSELRKQVSELRKQVDVAVSEARDTVDNAKAVTSAVAKEAEARSAEIEAMKSSTSWKVTAPFRSVVQMLRGGRSLNAKHKLKLLLQHLALYIARRPRLKRLALAVLIRFPGLKTRLAALRHQNISSSSRVYHGAPGELSHLNPHARRIYSDLKDAIDLSTKESH